MIFLRMINKLNTKIKYPKLEYDSVLMAKKPLEQRIIENKTNKISFCDNLFLINKIVEITTRAIPAKFNDSFVFKNNNTITSAI